MAAKKVTQKGREKRGAKAPAKRGAQAKSRAKPARGKRPTRARARKPKRAVADKRAARAAGADVELEAAVLRRLLQHFDERKDVQNIELMILAGFCRNCLSRWLVEEGRERGLEVDMDSARAKVYGMPYDEWKAKHQNEASPAQRAAFDKSHKH